MLTERELCGLDAYLRMRVLGETIKITAANLADVGALWWARKIETPPFNSCPVGSEEFRATVGGQIPRETLHGLAERAGISFLDATKLSLFDLVLLATAGRAAGQAAGAATGQATGQGEGDPASRDVQDGGDVSEDQDGPLPPNRFRFNGTCHNMRPVPWNLLYAMWGRESRHVNDVEAEVWEDSLPPEKTGTTMYRVNKVLEKAGYPSKLSRCADFLTWVSAEFPK